MKTGTSKLMDSQLVDFTTNTVMKSNTTTGNYAEEWDIHPIQEKNITVCSTFVPTPDYVGCYSVGGLSIYLEKRPKWLHRKMMKLCLGWEWIDN
jgi:hypothetical protein